MTTQVKMVAAAAISIIFALLPNNSIATDRAPRAPKNIILITLDTLRSDHTTYMGYPRNTTPFLAEIAKKGVLFKKMRTSIPYTKNSHEAIFTSKLPPNQDFMFMDFTRPTEKIRDPDGLQTIQGILAARGYPTAAFPSLNMMMKIFKHRFTYYSEEDPPPANVPRALRKKADDVVTRAITWLEQNKRQPKKFIWLHFFDPHYPYEQKTTYSPGPGDPDDDNMMKYWQGTHVGQFGIFREDERQTAGQLLNHYDGEIQYMDGQLKRFYDYFTSQNTPEDTLWIIIPDHGEGLSSHSYYSHHQKLYEEQMLTPAIIYYGKHYPPHTDGCDANNIDLLPTIAQLVGYPIKATDADGISLLPRLRKTAAPCKRTEAYALTPAGLDTIRDMAPPEDIENFKQHILNNQNANPEEAIQKKGMTPFNLPLKEKEVGVKHLIAIYSGKYKYIQSLMSAPELYDLEKDPRELNNISRELPDVTRAMEKIAKDRLTPIKSANKSTAATVKAPPSPEERAHLQQLKSLGY